MLLRNLVLSKAFKLSACTRVGWKVMATIRCLWNGFMASFTGVQHLCTFNIVTLLLITFYQIFGGHHTPPEGPSLFMSHIDRPIAQISSSLELHRVPRSGEEIIITWTHIGWVRWMFQNFPLPVAQVVRDSSGVTPCIVVKNIVEFSTSVFSRESMLLRSLRQSEKTNARDPVQHKRWTYSCCGVARWRKWMCCTCL